MEHKLKIDTLDSDPFAIITLQGDLAGPTVYELKHEGNRIVDYLGRHYVVLDLADIGFIDSGGIGVIMYMYKNCQRMGGRLAAVQPGPSHALNSLYQASLEKFIDFYSDSPAALAGLCEKCGLNVPPSLGEKVQLPYAPSTEEKIQLIEARLEKLESLLESLLSARNLN